MSVVKVYHGLIHLSPSFSDDGIAIGNYSLLLGQGKVKRIKKRGVLKGIKISPFVTKLARS